MKTIMVEKFLMSFVSRKDVREKLVLPNPRIRMVLMSVVGKLLERRLGVFYSKLIYLSCFEKEPLLLHST